jgi:hypothetical protein
MPSGSASLPSKLAIAGRHRRHESSCGGCRSLRDRHAAGSRVIAMDVVAILIAVAAFAVLLALIEGLDCV